MIHAGTISTGSGRTFSVVGAYWISSIRRLRNTTLPGLTATLTPTCQASVPTGFLPLTARSQSSTRCCRPTARLRPPFFSVCSSSSGLVARKFDGEVMSRIWRAQNCTTAS